MNCRKSRQARQRRVKQLTHAKQVQRDLFWNGRTSRGFTAPELKSFKKNPDDIRKVAYKMQWGGGTIIIRNTKVAEQLMGRRR
jgi:hypothetical protein